MADRDDIFPSGGALDAIVAVNETAIAPGQGSAGFRVHGYESALRLIDPAGSVTSADPFRVTFTVQLAPPERTQAFVDGMGVQRDGAWVGACGAGPPFVPDPCIASRSLVGDDAVISIWTTQFSDWAVLLPAPVVDAGGPYELTEGDQILLGGSGSGGTWDPVTYQWTPLVELDDPTSPTPTFVGLDDASYRIDLTATDSIGASASDEAVVTVLNADPSAGAIVAPSSQSAGQLVSASTQFTDPGLADTHDATIDWGDGTTCQTSVDDGCDLAQGSGGGSVTGQHTYMTPDTYDVTITIVDDDGGTTAVTHAITITAAPPSLALAPFGSVVEGDAGGTRSLTFPVTLSEPATSTVTVRYRIESMGSASPGSDFKGKTGTLTFKPSATTGKTATTKYVTVAIYPDTILEGDETFRVVLFDPSSGFELGNAEATGTIRDDDTVPGSPSVDVGDASIVEGDVGIKASSTNNAKVWVNLSSPATATVSVKVTVTAGSATAGADFKRTFTKTLTFKAGQRQKSVAIPIVPDAAAEADESVIVTLSDPTGPFVLGRTTGNLTIIDDD